MNIGSMLLDNLRLHDEVVQQHGGYKGFLLETISSEKGIKIKKLSDAYKLVTDTVPAKLTGIDDTLAFHVARRIVEIGTSVEVKAN